MATEKQKKAIINAVENGGNVTQAMRDAGYAEATINNPANLRESKAWIELMEEHLPDEALAKVHKEGLSAAKKMVIGGKDIGVFEPDYPTRHKYLDTGYKLKGRYAPEEKKITGNLSLTDLFEAGKDNDNKDDK